MPYLWQVEDYTCRAMDKLIVDNMREEGETMEKIFLSSIGRSYFSVTKDVPFQVYINISSTYAYSH